MYAIQLGKRLLTLYNEKTNQNLTAKEFFEREMFPVFFDHAKHLMNVHNSKFHYGVNAEELKDEVALGGSKATLQLKKLKLAIEEALSDPDLIGGSVLASGKAVGNEGTTSGQITNLSLLMGESDIWQSWIGVSLGVTVKGGFTMGILDDRIIWSLFKGWKHYRDFISQTPTIKGNQVETWNGIWLYYLFREDIAETELDEEPLGFINHRNNYVSPEKLDTIEWIKVILALSKAFPNQSLLAHTYQLGSTNTTAGFIPLHLKPIRGVFETAKWLFGQNGRLKSKHFTDKDILSAYETRLNFARACQLGAIGLFAIEPQYFSPKKEDKLSEKDFLTLENRIIWTTAILDNMEHYDLAAKLAAHLRRYKSNETGGKTVRKEEINSLLSRSSRKAFIDGLTAVLENERIAKDAESYADDFKKAVDESLKMPIDTFPLFVSLIRFLMVYNEHKPEVTLFQS